MELGKDQLITLENGRKYIITSDVIYEENKYYLLAGVLEDESDINHEFKIVKEIKNNDGVFVIEIDDEELNNKLITLFDIKEEK